MATLPQRMMPSRKTIVILSVLAGISVAVFSYFDNTPSPTPSTQQGGGDITPTIVNTQQGTRQIIIDDNIERPLEQQQAYVSDEEKQRDERYTNYYNIDGTLTIDNWDTIPLSCVAGWKTKTDGQNINSIPPLDSTMKASCTLSTSQWVNTDWENELTTISQTCPRFLNDSNQNKNVLHILKGCETRYCTANPSLNISEDTLRNINSLEYVGNTGDNANNWTMGGPLETIQTNFDGLKECDTGFIGKCSGGDTKCASYTNNQVLCVDSSANCSYSRTNFIYPNSLQCKEGKLTMQDCSTSCTIDASVYDETKENTSYLATLSTTNSKDYYSLDYDIRNPTFSDTNNTITCNDNSYVGEYTYDNSLCKNQSQEGSYIFGGGGKIVPDYSNCISKNTCGMLRTPSGDTGGQPYTCPPNQDNLPESDDITVTSSVPGAGPSQSDYREQCCSQSTVCEPCDTHISSNIGDGVSLLKSYVNQDRSSFGIEDCCEYKSCQEISTEIDGLCGDTQASENIYSGIRTDGIIDTSRHSISDYNTIGTEQLEEQCCIPKTCVDYPCPEGQQNISGSGNEYSVSECCIVTESSTSPEITANIGATDESIITEGKTDDYVIEGFNPSIDLPSSVEFDKPTSVSQGDSAALSSYTINYGNEGDPNYQKLQNLRNLKCSELTTNPGEPATVSLVNKEDGTYGYEISGCGTEFRCNIPESTSTAVTRESGEGTYDVQRFEVNGTPGSQIESSTMKNNPPAICSSYYTDSSGKDYMIYGNVATANCSQADPDITLSGCKYYYDGAQEDTTKSFGLLNPNCNDNIPGSAFEQTATQKPWLSCSSYWGQDGKLNQGTKDNPNLYQCTENQAWFANYLNSKDVDYCSEGNYLNTEYKRTPFSSESYNEQCQISDHQKQATETEDGSQTDNPCNAILQADFDGNTVPCQDITLNNIPHKDSVMISAGDGDLLTQAVTKYGQTTTNYLKSPLSLFRRDNSEESLEEVPDEERESYYENSNAYGVLSYSTPLHLFMNSNEQCSDDSDCSNLNGMDNYFCNNNKIDDNYNIVNELKEFSIIDDEETISSLRSTGILPVDNLYMYSEGEKLKVYTGNFDPELALIQNILGDNDAPQVIPEYMEWINGDKIDYSSNPNWIDQSGPNSCLVNKMSSQCIEDIRNKYGPPSSNGDELTKTLVDNPPGLLFSPRTGESSSNTNHMCIIDYENRYKNIVDNYSNLLNGINTETMDNIRVNDDTIEWCQIEKDLYDSSEPTICSMDSTLSEDGTSTTSCTTESGKGTCTYMNVNKTNIQDNYDKTRQISKLTMLGASGVYWYGRYQWAIINNLGTYDVKKQGYKKSYNPYLNETLTAKIQEKYDNKEIRRGNDKILPLKYEALGEFVDLQILYAIYISPYSRAVGAYGYDYNSLSPGFNNTNIYLFNKQPSLLLAGDDEFAQTETAQYLENLLGTDISSYPDNLFTGDNKFEKFYNVIQYRFGESAKEIFRTHVQEELRRRGKTESSDDVNSREIMDLFFAKGDEFGSGVEFSSYGEEILKRIQSLDGDLRIGTQSMVDRIASQGFEMFNRLTGKFPMRIVLSDLTVKEFNNYDELKAWYDNKYALENLDRWTTENIIYNREKSVYRPFGLDFLISWGFQVNRDMYYEMKKTTLQKMLVRNMNNPDGIPNTDVLLRTDDPLIQSLLDDSGINTEGTSTTNMNLSSNPFPSNVKNFNKTIFDRYMANDAVRDTYLTNDTLVNEIDPNRTSYIRSLDKCKSEGGEGPGSGNSGGKSSEINDYITQYHEPGEEEYSTALCEVSDNKKDPLYAGKWFEYQSFDYPSTPGDPPPEVPGKVSKDTLMPDPNTNSQYIDNDILDNYGFVDRTDPQEPRWLTTNTINDLVKDIDPEDAYNFKLNLCSVLLAPENYNYNSPIEIEESGFPTYKNSPNKSYHTANEICNSSIEDVNDKWKYMNVHESPTTFYEYYKTDYNISRRKRNSDGMWDDRDDNPWWVKRKLNLVTKEKKIAENLTRTRGAVEQLQDKYNYDPSKSPINPNSWETLNGKLLNYDQIDNLKKSDFPNDPLELDESEILSNLKVSDICKESCQPENTNIHYDYHKNKYRIQWLLSEYQRLFGTKAGESTPLSGSGDSESDKLNSMIPESMKTDEYRDFINRVNPNDILRTEFDSRVQEDRESTQANLEDIDAKAASGLITYNYNYLYNIKSIDILTPMTKSEMTLPAGLTFSSGNIEGCSLNNGFSNDIAILRYKFFGDAMKICNQNPTCVGFSAANAFIAGTEIHACNEYVFYKRGTDATDRQMNKLQNIPEERLATGWDLGGYLESSEGGPRITNSIWYGTSLDFQNSGFFIKSNISTESQSQDEVLEDIFIKHENTIKIKDLSGQEITDTHPWMGGSDNPPYIVNGCSGWGGLGENSQKGYNGAYLGPTAEEAKIMCDGIESCSGFFKYKRNGSSLHGSRTCWATITPGAIDWSKYPEPGPDGTRKEEELPYTLESRDTGDYYLKRPNKQKEWFDSEGCRGGLGNYNQFCNRTGDLTLDGFKALKSYKRNLENTINAMNLSYTDLGDSILNSGYDNFIDTNESKLPSSLTQEYNYFNDENKCINKNFIDCTIDNHSETRNILKETESGVTAQSGIPETDVSLYKKQTCKTCDTVDTSNPNDKYTIQNCSKQSNTVIGNCIDHYYGRRILVPSADTGFEEQLKDLTCIKNDGSSCDDDIENSIFIDKTPNSADNVTTKQTVYSTIDDFLRNKFGVHSDGGSSGTDATPGTPGFYNTSRFMCNLDDVDETKRYDNLFYITNDDASDFNFVDSTNTPATLDEISVPGGTTWSKPLLTTGEDEVYNICKNDRAVLKKLSTNEAKIVLGITQGEDLPGESNGNYYQCRTCDGTLNSGSDIYEYNSLQQQCVNETNDCICPGGIALDNETCTNFLGTVANYSVNTGGSKIETDYSKGEILKKGVCINSDGEQEQQATQETCNGTWYNTSVDPDKNSEDTDDHQWDNDKSQENDFLHSPCRISTDDINIARSLHVLKNISDLPTNMDACPDNRLNFDSLSEEYNRNTNSSSDMRKELCNVINYFGKNAFQSIDSGGATADATTGFEYINNMEGANREDKIKFIQNRSEQLLNKTICGIVKYDDLVGSNMTGVVNDKYGKLLKGGGMVACQACGPIKEDDPDNMNSRVTDGYPTDNDNEYWIAPNGVCYYRGNLGDPCIPDIRDLYNTAKDLGAPVNHMVDNSIVDDFAWDSKVSSNEYGHILDAKKDGTKDLGGRISGDPSPESLDSTHFIDIPNDKYNKRIPKNEQFYGTCRKYVKLTSASPKERTHVLGEKKDTIEYNGTSTLPTDNQNYYQSSNPMYVPGVYDEQAALFLKTQKQGHLEDSITTAQPDIYRLYGHKTDGFSDRVVDSKGDVKYREKDNPDGDLDRENSDNLNSYTGIKWTNDGGLIYLGDKFSQGFTEQPGVKSFTDDSTRSDKHKPLFTIDENNRPDIHGLETKQRLRCVYDADDMSNSFYLDKKLENKLMDGQDTPYKRLRSTAPYSQSRSVNMESQGLQGRCLLESQMVDPDTNPVGNFEKFSDGISFKTPNSRRDHRINVNTDSVEASVGDCGGRVVGATKHGSVEQKARIGLPEWMGGSGTSLGIDDPENSADRFAAIRTPHNVFYTSDRVAEHKMNIINNNLTTMGVDNSSEITKKAAKEIKVVNVPKTSFDASDKATGDGYYDSGWADTGSSYNYSSHIGNYNTFRATDYDNPCLLNEGGCENILLPPVFGGPMSTNLSNYLYRLDVGSNPSIEGNNAGIEGFNVDSNSQFTNTSSGTNKRDTSGENYDIGGRFSKNIPYVQIYPQNDVDSTAEGLYGENNAAISALGSSAGRFDRLVTDNEANKADYQVVAIDDDEFQNFNSNLKRGVEGYERTSPDEERYISPLITEISYNLKNSVNRNPFYRDETATGVDNQTKYEFEKSHGVPIMYELKGSNTENYYKPAQKILDAQDLDFDYYSKIGEGGVNNMKTYNKMHHGQDMYGGRDTKQLIMTTSDNFGDMASLMCGSGQCISVADAENEGGGRGGIIDTDPEPWTGGEDAQSDTLADDRGSGYSRVPGSIEYTSVPGDRNIVGGDDKESLKMWSYDTSTNNNINSHSEEKYRSIDRSKGTTFPYSGWACRPRYQAPSSTNSIDNQKRAQVVYGAKFN